MAKPKTKEYRKFLQAVDEVCLWCVKCEEKHCKKCPVRKTCDYWYNQDNKEE